MFVFDVVKRVIELFFYKKKQKKTINTYTIGHFINNCPTIGNKEYDNRPRLKKTTGIPKMFLQTVESKEGSGLMVSATGDIVVARPSE